MKKLSPILMICTALAISASPAFASTYNPTYSPTHGTITEVSGTINSGFSGCGRDATLSVLINGTTATSTYVNFSSNCGGTPTFDITGLSIAITDSDVVSLNVSPDGNGNYIVTSATMTVASGGSSNTGSVTSFSVPTSTAPTLMAYASGLLANPGFLAIIALIIGVPFAFWAIDKLIALVPGNDKKRRHK